MAGYARIYQAVCFQFSVAKLQIAKIADRIADARNSFISDRVLDKIIMLKRNNGSKAISASEISQYVYCPVSWYLKRCGVQPQSYGLKRGIDAHEKAGSRLVLLERRERAAGVFRLMGYFSVVAAILLMGWVLWTYF